MPVESAALINKINRLLSNNPGDDLGHAAISEALHGALTLATSVYGGPESPQVKTLLNAAQQAREAKGDPHYLFRIVVWPAVVGALQAMREDIEGGLINNIERHAAGEVLADMLALGKEALSNGTDGAKNVAAVLTAAAFEDAIRKLGSTLANVQGRPDLSAVLTALKTTGVLVGAPYTTAQSYLKFRNDALHADWSKLNAAVVGSCLSFVEQLVLQPFST